MQANKRIWLLLFMSTTYFWGSAQFPIASWKGYLQIKGETLPLLFHIHGNNATLQGTMDSPNQGALGLPLDSVWVQGDSIFLNYKTLNVSYKGKYIDFDDSIVGIFSQNGFNIPLKLGSVNDSSISKQTYRPQTPPYDVNYNIEEVEIPNKHSHINLAGTLTLPFKKMKPTCIVLVSGSGPQNRDEEILGHKPFWVLADFLTRNGYAVLRYDDRGTAKSKGNYETATIDTFASDAYAAVQYLETRNDIGRIGMTGHSEGGAIVQQVAAEHSKDIALIMMLAGPGLRGDSLMLLQKQAVESRLGFSQHEVQRGLRTLKGAYNIVLDNPKWSYGMPKVKDYLFETLQEQHPEQSDKNIVAMQQTITNAFTQEFYSIIRFDPAQYLPRIVCPILALNGSKDMQVLPTENLSSIHALTTQNKKTTIKEINGLNHLFQEAKTGLPNEYGEISQTFAPIAMNGILEWLRSNGF